MRTLAPILGICFFLGCASDQSRAPMTDAELDATTAGFSRGNSYYYEPGGYWRQGPDTDVTGERERGNVGRLMSPGERKTTHFDSDTRVGQ